MAKIRSNPGMRWLETSKRQQTKKLASERAKEEAKRQREIAKYNAIAEHNKETEAKAQAWGERGYVQRYKTKYGTRYDFRFKKPKAAGTLAGRPVYTGPQQETLIPYAEQELEKVRWSSEEPQWVTPEGEALYKGVVRFAKLYGRRYLDQVAAMDPEVLQRLYEQASIVFEVYFQYSDISYDETRGIFVEDDYGGSQFQYLIDKYNELASLLGRRTV